MSSRMAGRPSGSLRRRWKTLNAEAAIHSLSQASQPGTGFRSAPFGTATDAYHTRYCRCCALPPWHAFLYRTSSIRIDLVCSFVS
jgi:hypothetical protein